MMKIIENFSDMSQYVISCFNKRVNDLKTELMVLHDSLHTTSIARLVQIYPCNFLVPLN